MITIGKRPTTLVNIGAPSRDRFDGCPYVTTRCMACGEEFEEHGIVQYLCDQCFDVEREMVIEALGDDE